MRAPAPGDDDTVRMPAGGKTPIAGAKRGNNKLWLFGGIAVAALIVIGGGIFALMGGPPAVPIDTETEAQIDAVQPCDIKVSYFAPDHDIVVIDFPSLTLQGLTLNRVAALVEKAKLPRDRVLNDAQLNQAIFDCGDTIESYYYGHDYKAADLQKFFSLADQEGIKLNPHEIWLKHLLKQLGWLTPGANGAIITLPAAGGPISEEMRAVILHHEISHGAFYTIPAYADYARKFWYSLTQTDRDAFTNFLGSEGYDTADTTLMLNETQAYLIFTRDPHFFNGSVVNMNQAQVDTLREGFIANMPNIWLQPMANAALPIGAAQAACAG
jgi:hypothetical protein